MHSLTVKIPQKTKKIAKKDQTGTVFGVLKLTYDRFSGLAAPFEFATSLLQC